MDEVFEGLVREGMARMRWTRKRAEKAAHRYLKRKGVAKAKSALAVLHEAKSAPVKAAPKIRVVKRAEMGEARRVLTPNEAAELKAAGEAGKKKWRKNKAHDEKARKKMKKARAKQAAVAAAVAQPAAKRAKLKKKPLTALQRLELAMGPDDGRRRGGSPFVQGGAPGLGKRR